MMSAISAALTLLISGVVFQWRKDRRELQQLRQALERAKRDLLESRLAVERGEREAADHRAETVFDDERLARPSAEIIVGPVLRGEGLSYRFRIRNRGKVSADGLTVWLVDDAGTEASPPAGPLPKMEPDESHEITLHTHEGAHGALRLYFHWRDPTGFHQRESWVRVPRPDPQPRHRADPSAP